MTSVKSDQSPLSTIVLPTAPHQIHVSHRCRTRRAHLPTGPGSPCEAPPPQKSRPHQASEAVVGARKTNDAAARQSPRSPERVCGSGAALGAIRFDQRCSVDDGWRRRTERALAAGSRRVAAASSALARSGCHEVLPACACKASSVGCVTSRWSRDNAYSNAWVEHKVGCDAVESASSCVSRRACPPSRARQACALHFHFIKHSSLAVDGVGCASGRDSWRRFLFSVCVLQKTSLAMVHEHCYMVSFRQRCMHGEAGPCVAENALVDHDSLRFRG